MEQSNLFIFLRSELELETINDDDLFIISMRIRAKYLSGLSRDSFIFKFAVRLAIVTAMRCVKHAVSCCQSIRAIVRSYSSATKNEKQIRANQIDRAAHIIKFI